jgi:hypothetical protein
MPLECIWSRREELNAPPADYNSAALTLSYTGEPERLGAGVGLAKREIIKGTHHLPAPVFASFRNTGYGALKVGSKVVSVIVHSRRGRRET